MLPLLMLTSKAALATDTSRIDTTFESTKSLELLYNYKLDSLRLAQSNDYSPHISPNEFVPFMVFLVPIVALVVAFILGRQYLTTRNAERMAMIERGVDASLFNTGNEATNKYRALRLGMLFGGIGLGFVVGTILDRGVTRFEDGYGGIVIISSALLFGGLGLLAYYLIVRRLERS